MFSGFRPRSFHFVDIYTHHQATVPGDVHFPLVLSVVSKSRSTTVVSKSRSVVVVA